MIVGNGRLVKVQGANLHTGELIILLGEVALVSEFGYIAIAQCPQQFAQCVEDMHNDESQPLAPAQT